MVKLLTSDIVFHLNNKQRRTWDKILVTPTTADLSWEEVHSLFVSLGAEINYNLPRVRVRLHSVKLYFRKPSKGDYIRKWNVEKIREFLLKATI